MNPDCTRKKLGRREKGKKKETEITDKLLHLSVGLEIYNGFQFVLFVFCNKLSNYISHIFECKAVGVK